MDIPTLSAWPREEQGSRPCRRLRKEGLVPAVLYGRGKPNVMLKLERQDMEDLLEHHAFVFQVEVEGKEVPVQLLEVQYDSIGEEILHTDLGRISLSEQIEVSVPVETHGEAAGVREEGGVLEVIHHELTVACLPGNVPEDIRVEVADLNIGDDLRIADIEFPEGVKPVDDPDEVVVTCATPTEMITEEEEEALTEEFMAEPEVIGREEEEEEEGEELPEEEEEVESDGEE